MGWSPNPQRHHQVGVEPIIGTGLAPDPHLAPLTTGHLHAWLGKIVLRGPWETCSALWTHTPCCWEATKKAELTPQVMQTDGWTEPPSVGSQLPRPTPTRIQGRPESAGLQPEAGRRSHSDKLEGCSRTAHSFLLVSSDSPLPESLAPGPDPPTSGKARGVCGEKATGRPALALCLGVQ